MTLNLTNPATGKIFTELRYHSFEDARALLEKAEESQKQWKSTSMETRIALVKDAMEYFKRNKDEVARDITMQMGKPISQSRNEVIGMIHRASVCCELSVDALKDILIPKQSSNKRFIKREPLGIVLNIAAWNYPLLIAVNVVVPAVLA